MGRTGFPGILRGRKMVSVGILRAEVGFRENPDEKSALFKKGQTALSLSFVSPAVSV